MRLTVNIYYTGTCGKAKEFAREMTECGIADQVRAEEGNQGCAYFFPMDDPETVLLIDSWRDQAASDAHHKSPMMQQIASLRTKYGLRMRVERFVEVES